MPNKFYNYIYLDPRKPGQYCYEGLNFSLLYEPFYVGKGSGNRKNVHLYLASKDNIKKNHKIYKIRKIQEETNVDPYIIQINNRLTNKESCNIEIFIIAKIGRIDLGSGSLVNFTNGGEGTTNLSRESRKIMSEKATNRKQSVDTINKRVSKITGLIRTEATKQLMKDKRKLQIVTDEHRKIMSIAHTGLKQNKETIDKRKNTIAANNISTAPKNQIQKFYKVTTPGNTTLYLNTENLIMYCRDNNLPYNTFLKYTDKGIITSTFHKKNRICINYIIEFIGKFPKNYIHQP